MKDKLQFGLLKVCLRPIVDVVQQALSRFRAYVHLLWYVQKRSVLGGNVVIIKAFRDHRGKVVEMRTDNPMLDVIYTESDGGRYRKYVTADPGSCEILFQAGNAWEAFSMGWVPRYPFNRVCLVVLCIAWCFIIVFIVIGAVALVKDRGAALLEISGLLSR